ncbi:MAG: ribosome biogenesis GTP-binding protein YihA/YsxC [Pseudomonadaceae bacterium]|nr:ribosome biogenesis GTP-binding protein YihA/YsxC [Pseudomonadaceae bacterium]
MAKQAPESDLQRLHVEFLTSAPSRRECPPEGEPEIAVAGRSNAGKSSVLNRLTGSRRTAKVSKTPGRTQLLNFFSVRGGGRIVDLPGYGYAKSNLAAQRQWQASVNDYLSNRDALAGLVLVMDIRHPLQSLDEELLAWSGASDIPTLVLLNKADKLKRGAQAKQMAIVKKRCGADLLCFSASTGQGNDEAIAWLQPILTSGVDATSPYGEVDDLDE